MMQRDAAKERKKERERKEKERKERERRGRGLEREKEKEKEKAKEKDEEKSVPLKVKIKLPTPLSSTSSLSSISSSSSSVVGIGVDVVLPPAPVPIQPPQVNSNGNGVKQDPALIPLPTSRAASPFPSSCNAAAAAAAIQPPALMPTPLRESHTAELGGDDATGSSSMMTTTTNSTDPEAVDAIPVTTPTTATATATTEATNTNPNSDDLLSTTARGQYRSPKRTFDESSASGGEDPEGGRDRDGGEGGRERRRRRVGSLVGTAEAGSAASLVGATGGGTGVDCGTPPPPLLRSPGMNVDVDIDVVDVEMDADMPGLTTSSVGDSSSSSLSSSPLSSSPLSSEAGSEVWSASASPAPEVEGEEVDMDPTTPVAASKPYTNGTKNSNPPPSSIKKPKRFPHPYEAGGGGVEKQLTRRQRKALGLPKQRNVPPYLASGAKGASASAGKIVIPGGRWTGRASPAGAAAIPGVADPSGVEEEWRRNGTGRVDVRGFRELKI